ncbi:HEAT repeat domain-containing protein [Oscillatoria sp. FACHB-1407]|uniref:HEAT repeat domain-containing protein n=1 Tax=Oscillatoria sp. FACHB-1407 TaxID=2692847 RepID=UPI001685B0C8|nr:HEAT repeat domain-containing protein [Oscillatoria sp. FACHB-1407]MBD2459825.1 HEAT repeat domain-containing protein [Oscillatoria sp. FACHB-1407]
MTPLNPHSLLKQAQTAIAQSNWTSSIDSLQDVVWQQSSATSAAVDLVLNEVLSLALTILESGDFQSRWDVAKLFPGLGNRAIAPLISRLQDDTAELEVRWFAARILGEFRHPDVITTLVQTLQTCKNEELSGIIAVALSSIGAEAAQNGSPAEVIAALTDLFNAPQTRRWAVQILSRMPHSESVPLLLQAADDPQANIRAIAIDALTNFHDPRILDVFMRATADPVATVRVAAVTGLGLRADALPETDLVGTIQPLLFDLNAQVCEQAAIALGHLGTEAAVDALADVLQSPHTPDPLRLTLLQTLGWMETSRAIAAVQQFLRHQTASSSAQSIIQASLQALTQVSSPALKHQIAQFLIELLQSRHPVTQTEANRQLLAVGLGQLGEPTALEPLIQLLADPDMGVQLHAIAALKHLDSQTAHYRLMELSQTQNLKADLSRGLAIALREW